MALIMIGDPKQTLYLFRNSNPELLEGWNKIIEGSSRIELLKNYRSPKELVLLSNFYSKVFNELDVGESECVRESKKGVLSFGVFDNVEKEIKFVSSEIGRLIKSGVEPEKISVLARVNKSLVDVESGLIGEGVAYNIRYDNRSVLNQSAFKIMYAVYSILFNDKDIFSLSEILLMLNGVGNKYLDRLRSFYLSKDVSVFEIEEFCLGSSKDKIVIEFVRKVLNPIRNVFCSDISFIYFNMEIKRILNSECCFDGEKKKGFKLNIEREQFDKVFKVLSSIYRIMSEDKEVGFRDVYENLQISLEKEERGVYLSTLHSFKGRENDYIFVINLKPSRRVKESFEDKCVMYVAVTRAREKLYLTASEWVRTVKGELIKAPGNILLNRYLEGVECL